ncbi:hypothetical protein LY76DRAFT_62109 [Colletotrichum caudatum]|nr:hypothetical protein LY76DRAFT_62109 [Colletotrichum caudatum]
MLMTTKGRDPGFVRVGHLFSVLLHVCSCVSLMPACMPLPRSWTPLPASESAGSLHLRLPCGEPLSWTRVAANARWASQSLRGGQCRYSGLVLEHYKYASDHGFFMALRRLLPFVTCKLSEGRLLSPFKGTAVLPTGQAVFCSSQTSVYDDLP